MDNTQHGGNERFNAEAAAWDNNPFVREMSTEAWKAIQTHLPSMQFGNSNDSARPDVLEIGCGTGLLSMEVAPAVKRLIAVDAAEGMIGALSSKLKKPDAPKNITPLAMMLVDPEDKGLPPSNAADPDGPRLKFDLIMSHLVLHHIEDHKSLLATMFGCLKQDGMVALTDFEDFGPEARLFHPESKMGGVEHHGIKREIFKELLQEAGFVDIKVNVAWEHSKLVERFPGEFRHGEPTSSGEGKIMKFSYLICLGKKP